MLLPQHGFSQALLCVVLSDAELQCFVDDRLSAKATRSRGRASTFRAVKPHHQCIADGVLSSSTRNISRLHQNGDANLQPGIRFRIRTMFLPGDA